MEKHDLNDNFETNEEINAGDELDNQHKIESDDDISKEIKSLQEELKCVNKKCKSLHVDLISRAKKIMKVQKIQHQIDAIDLEVKFLSFNFLFTFCICKFFTSDKRDI